MTALEKKVNELDELVDGHQPWSHRTRLHALNNLVSGEKAVRDSAEMVARAVDSYKLDRQNRSTRVREWGAFTLAVVAVLRPWEYL